MKLKVVSPTNPTNDYGPEWSKRFKEEVGLDNYTKHHGIPFH
jgi:hypothetical protein